MRKNYIKKEDYDFYSIEMPLKIAFSRKRKNFILRELEKMHPKLTASCFIKSWFRLKKGKIQAFVAVIEKNLIAGYKKQFSLGNLYIPEKGKFVLSGSKYSIFAGIFLLLIAGIFSGKMIYETFFQKKKISADEKLSLSNDKKINSEAILPVLLAPSELVAAVFSSVSKNGGRISSFSWERGICTFSINGCSSEDVAQAQYCVVSYKDNKPHFTLAVPVSEKTDFTNEDNESSDAENSPYSQFRKSLENASNARDLIETLRKMRSTGEIELLTPENFNQKNRNNAENSRNQDENPENKKVDCQSSIKKVREELFRLGASIQQEHLTEKSAEFEFSVPEEIFYSALKICGTEAKKIGWKETSFSVEKSGSQNHVKVAFSREKEDQNINACFSPLLLTASYAWLFKSESLKLVPKSAPLFTAAKNRPFENREKMKNWNSQEKREKLGEIKRNDGFTYVYYKKSDGKITCERKEAVNAM